MKDPAAKNRLAAVLLFVAFGWLMLFQPVPAWSGAVEISSARVAVSLHSDTVRFRTLLSGNGRSCLALAFGNGRA